MIDVIIPKYIVALSYLLPPKLQKTLESLLGCRIETNGCTVKVSVSRSTKRNNHVDVVLQLWI